MKLSEGTKKNTNKSGDDSDFDIYEALETATLINLSLLEFWELTPFEFSLVIKAKNNQIERESEEKLRLVYLQSLWTSRFVWQKTIPSLEELTNQKEKKSMTSEEMLEEIKRLNASLGGTTY